MQGTWHFCALWAVIGYDISLYSNKVVFCQAGYCYWHFWGMSSWERLKHTDLAG